VKLGDFGLLADENIHPAVVVELRAMGFDVSTAREEGLAGRDDSILLKAAGSQNRVVVTHDADFGALAMARLEPFVGIVFLRPGHIDPQFTIQTLRLLAAQDLPLATPFIVVAKRTGKRVSIRVRNL
jgi:predicted nuclease of predicted toxin-antitoxin system